MLRLITFLEEAAGVELVLPVTPSSYQWAHETVTVDQLGDLNFFGGKRMGSTTLHDCLLPAQAYPFLSPGAGTNPWLYLEQLERWVDRGTVVRWLVSGTPVNAAVLLEGVTYREQDGTNDLYLTIVMRQWKKPEIPVLSVSGGSAQTARDSPGQAHRPESPDQKPQPDLSWSGAHHPGGERSSYRQPGQRQRGPGRRHSVRLGPGHPVMDVEMRWRDGVRISPEAGGAGRERVS